jgi:predicted GIY-YIG superfamily endonuclease
MNNPQSPHPVQAKEYPVITNQSHPNTEKSKNGANQTNQHFHCYLLRSLDPKHASKTYVGFTVDPKRRLRQHNGVVQGGARKTSRQGRPWEFTVVIHGFPSQIKGLQFEWAWQHVDKSLAVRTMIGSEAASFLKRRQRTTKGQLTILKTLMTYVASELIFETMKNQGQRKPPKPRTRKISKRNKKFGGCAYNEEVCELAVNIESCQIRTTADQSENVELSLYFFDRQYFDLYNAISCPAPEPSTNVSTTETSTENEADIAPVQTIHIQTTLVESVENMPFFQNRRKKRQERRRQPQQQPQEYDDSHEPYRQAFEPSTTHIAECMGCHRPIQKYTQGNNRIFDQEDTIQCSSCCRKMHAVCGEIYRREVGCVFHRRANIPCPYCKANTLLFESDDDDLEYEEEVDVGDRIPSDREIRGYGRSVDGTESDICDDSTSALLSQKHKNWGDTSIIELSDDGHESNGDETASDDLPECDSHDDVSDRCSCNGVAADLSWPSSFSHDSPSSPASTADFIIKEPVIGFDQDCTEKGGMMWSPVADASPGPVVESSEINEQVGKRSKALTWPRSLTFAGHVAVNDQSIVCIDCSSDEEEKPDSDDVQCLSVNDDSSVSSGSSCMSYLSPLRPCRTNRLTCKPTNKVVPAASAARGVRDSRTRPPYSNKRVEIIDVCSP